MIAKKSLVVLIVWMFIFLGFLKIECQVNEEQMSISPETFFENLEILAGKDTKDETTGQLFENIIGNTRQLGDIIVSSKKKGGKEIERKWQSKAVDIGKYLGTILIRNSQKAEKLEKLKQFLIELKSDLSNQEYYTAGRDIYNSMINVTKTDSNGEFKWFINAGGLEESKTTSQTFGGFNTLAQILSAYQARIEQKEIIKKEIGTLKNILKGLDTTIQKKVTEEIGKIEKLLYKDFFRIGVLLLFAVIALNLILVFFLVRPRKIFKKLDKFDSGFSELESRFNDDINHLKNKKIYINEIILTNNVKEEILMADQNGSPVNFDKLFMLYKKQVGNRLKNIESELEKMKQGGYTDGGSGDVNGLEQRIKYIEEQLEKIMEFLKVDKGEQSIMNSIEAIPGKITEKIVTTEREILKEIWNWEIFKSLKERLTALSEGIQDTHFFDLCYKFEKKLSFNKDFLHSYRNVIKTLRNYDERLTKIVNIPKVIGEDPNNQLKGPTPELDLKLIRKNIYFLIALQNTNNISELLDFKIDRWVKEEFWEFADQFLKYYQRSIYKENSTGELGEVKMMIEKILTFANIEAITIELGKTRFDGKLHIGRSYTKESSMYDGTIADVVRNGYREINGVVIQQPEVIVNRL